MFFFSDLDGKGFCWPHLSVNGVDGVFPLPNIWINFPPGLLNNREILLYGTKSGIYHFHAYIGIRRYSIGFSPMVANVLDDHCRFLPGLVFYPD